MWVVTRLEHPVHGRHGVREPEAACPVLRAPRLWAHRTALAVHLLPSDPAAMAVGWTGHRHWVTSIREPSGQACVH